MSKKINPKESKTLQNFLAATDEILDAFQQVNERFTNKGNSFSLKDAIGKEGEVSVAIPREGTGEVVLSLGRGLHNYPAKAIKGNAEIKSGTRVQVMELANQILLVAPCKNEH